MTTKVIPFPITPAIDSIKPRFSNHNQLNKLTNIKKSQRNRSKENSNSNNYHGLGLGVKRSNEIGRVLLLEPDTRSERVLIVVLEDATRRIVDEHQPLLSAHVGQRQRADDVCPDRLHLVGLAPVDVRPAGDAGGVEHVRRRRPRQVVLQLGPVLEAAGAVLVLDPLGLADPAQQAPDPPGAPVDQELQLRRSVALLRVHDRLANGFGY